MIIWGGSGLILPISTQAEDTIPARTDGQPLALPTRLLDDTLTRQCGLAAK